MLKQDEIEDFAYLLSEIDPRYDTFETLEKEFQCKIVCQIEEHHVLQLTHHYEVRFDSWDESLYIEIESGINNGTVVNDFYWDTPKKPLSKTIEYVLKDIILDADYYKDPNERRIAQQVLNDKKKELFEHHRKNAYDNYVTGGNSKYKSKDKLDLHLDYIYESVEVNRRIIN